MGWSDDTFFQQSGPMVSPVIVLQMNDTFILDSSLLTVVELAPEVFHQVIEEDLWSVSSSWWRLPPQSTLRSDAVMSVFFLQQLPGFLLQPLLIDNINVVFLSERLQSLPHSSLLPLSPCIVVTPPDTTQLKACVYQHTLSPHIQNSQVMWFNLLCGALTLTPHD